MKTLPVVCICLLVAGCGSMGSSSTVSNVAMQAGQWEYVVVPEKGSITMYIDANVPGTNVQFSGTNAVIFQPSQVGVVDSTSPIYCTDLDISGGINGSGVSGKLSWGDPAVHFADFSGDLSANGQSISNGKYLGEACSGGNGPGTPGPQMNGTLTAYKIAPVNGTYTGTLNSSVYGAAVVTFIIKQNSDYSLNFSGMSVANGVTSMLVASTQPQSNIVTGATVYLGGTAENVNGSNGFSFAGHLNPTATQLTAAVMNLGTNETVTGTGTLTKQ
jgi:hypothetical protein